MTKTKTINPIDYIAIDVSKATLQVQDDQRSFALDNDSKGHLKLLKHLKTCQNPLVVFEASGGYEARPVRIPSQKGDSPRDGQPGQNP
jgi:transposase